MKKSARQFFKSSVYTYLGFALGGFTLLFLLPAIMEPDQIGLIQVLNSYSAVVLYFLALGFPYAVLRFFPNYDKEKRKMYLSYSLIIAFILSALLVIACFSLEGLYLPWFQGKSALFLNYFKYFSVLALGLILFEILASVFRVHALPTIPSFFREVGIRSLNLGVFILFALKLISFHTVIVLFSLTGIAVFILLLYMAKRKQILELGNPRFSVSKREFLVYGVYSFLGIGTVTMAFELDTIIIHQLTDDLGAIARYKIAFFIAMLVSLPSRALFPIIHPQVSSAFHNNNLAPVAKLYKTTSANLIFIGSLIVSLILTNAANIELLLPEKYRGIQTMLLIICIARWVDTATGINGVILVQSPRYKADLIMNIFLLVISVISNLILVRYYGVTGGAIAALISLALYNLLRIAYIQKYYSMQPFMWSNVATILAFTGISWGIYLLPSFSNVWVDIAFKTMLTSVLSFALLLRTNLAPESAEFVRALIKRYLRSGTQ